MSVIHQDEISPYVSAGGWISRPLFPTQFQLGEEVKTHHFGGSCNAGVGKDETCGRGIYLELWTTTGMIAGDRPSDRHIQYYGTTDMETQRESYDFYRRHSVGHPMGPITGRHPMTNRPQREVWMNGR